MAARPATEGSADQRRDAMLRAAAELIAERGFADTRIADVAKRVGASPALVIYYFGTKDRLLTEALRFSEQSFYAAADRLLASTSSIEKRLDALVQLTCIPQDYDDIPGAWGLWFDLWAQAFRHPEVKRDRVELDQRWRSIIERIVRDGIRAGEIAEVDAKQFAVTFAALLDGLSIQTALEDPEVDPQRAYGIAMDFAAGTLGISRRAKRRRRSSASTRR